MKCPKCNYTSFDYLDNCKRCGTELRDARSLLQIIAVSPEDQAPAAPPAEAMEEEFMSPEGVGEGSGYLESEHGDQDEEILEGMDFDGSFDDLVEPTSYADQESSPAPAPEPEPQPVAAQQAEEEEEELLDLDFGDLFEEKEE
jgi:hypothetical protein